MWFYFSVFLCPFLTPFGASYVLSSHLLLLSYFSCPYVLLCMLLWCCLSYLLFQFSWWYFLISVLSYIIFLLTFLYILKSAISFNAYAASTQVAVLPPRTQACCFNIKSFHRTCPVLLDHKPFPVVSFEGKFYIDHNHPFGARPASSNAGQIANALVDIWTIQLGDNSLLFKFEDNINCFQFPNTSGPFHHNNFLYAHDRDSVLDLVSCLNVPWHAKKLGTEFTDSF